MKLIKVRKRKLISKSFRENSIKGKNFIKKQIFKKVTSHACTNLNNTANIREQITADNKLCKR
jgi:hypothetical protein